MRGVDRHGRRVRVWQPSWPAIVVAGLVGWVCVALVCVAVWP